MGLLEGRRLLVTGGGSGIGAAVAVAFAGEGARVAVLDRRADAATAVAEQVGGVAVVADVGDGEGVRAAVDEVVAALGGLDGLVINAGIGNLARLVDESDATWDLLIKVNLTGAWHTLRACVAHLQAAAVERGVPSTVVTVSSVSGMRPTFGESPYSVAKAGLIALTASAALELAPDVRVNGVAPGFIDTPLTAPALVDPRAVAAISAGTPLGRPGEASEVADVVVFLSSGRSSYMTGQHLVVDGGSMLPSLQTDALLRGFLGG